MCMKMSLFTQLHDATEYTAKYHSKPEGGAPVAEGTLGGEGAGGEARPWEAGTRRDWREGCRDSRRRGGHLVSARRRALTTVSARTALSGTGGGRDAQGLCAAFPGAVWFNLSEMLP